MAVASRHIPIDRDQMQAWLDEYDGKNKTNAKLKDFLIAKIEGESLDDTDVDTSARDDFAEDATPLVDMLLADLSSYARHKKSTA